MPPRPKKVKVLYPPIKKLKKDYDFIFSWYVRLSNMLPNGRVRCITCSKEFEPIKIQAGHYWSRKESVLRYSTINVQPQCNNCNCSIYGGGKPQEFALFLTGKYGGDVLSTLEQEKTISIKMKPWEYIEKIRYYTGEVLVLSSKVKISKKLKLWIKNPPRYLDQSLEGK